MPGDVEDKKKRSQQEMFQICFEISKLLNTGLDAESLKYCIRLCESGVNPEKVAKMVSEMNTAIKTIEKKLENKENSQFKSSTSLDNH
ncbi:hypothetical protein O3M35_000859 [Rhynocoris fuscipes]|uniref:Mitotic-spindle organizing protein 1 n=1 Tax=Rhynocoris fuscipes TaxID=488301 RepID=A0AAW1DP67_9HEMI